MTYYEDNNRNIFRNGNIQYNNGIKNGSGVRNDISETASEAVRRIRAEKRKAETKRQIRARQDYIKAREEVSKQTQNDAVQYIDMKEKKNPISVSFVFMSIILTVVIMFLVLNYSEISEYTNDVNSLKTQVAELETEKSRLEVSLDKKTNLEQIENTVSSLGMVKSEKLAKKYISSGLGEKIEKSSGGEDEYNISAMMSGFTKLFKDVVRGKNK